MGRSGAFHIALVAATAVLLLVSCSRSGSSANPVKPPNPPESVRLEALPEGLSVAWDCVRGATHYTVFWGTSREAFSHLVNSEKCRTVIKQARKGKLFFVAVTAWNKRGESSYSTPEMIVYETDPQCAPQYLAWANDCMERGLLEDAHLYYSTLIRIAPETVEAYRKRAEIHEKRGEYGPASRDRRRAWEILNGKRLSGSVSRNR